MRKSSVIFCGLLLAGVLLLGSFLLNVSEEDEIIGLLEEVRALSEVTEKEHPLEQLGKAKKIASFFSEPVEIDFENLDYQKIVFNDLKKLAGQVAQARAALDSLELGIKKPKIDLQEYKAQVDVDGSALGSMHGEDGQFFDLHRIRIYLVKEEDGWKISGAKHLKNLRN